MAGYPACRGLFPGCVGSLHVGAHFDHVEYAVAVPCHGHGFLDLRFAENELKGVAIGQLYRLVGFLDGEESSLVDLVSGGGERLFSYGWQK